MADGQFIGDSPNCYGFCDNDNYCYLSGNQHPFEWQDGAIKPEWNGQGDVSGCGILLDSKKKVSIFFTANGILMGQIPLWLVINGLI